MNMSLVGPFWTNTAHVSTPIRVIPWGWEVSYHLERIDGDRHSHIYSFEKGMVYNGKTLLKRMIWGVPLFSKTSVYCFHHWLFTNHHLLGVALRHLLSPEWNSSQNALKLWAPPKNHFVGCHESFWPAPLKSDSIETPMETKHPWQICNGDLFGMVKTWPF